MPRVPRTQYRKDLIPSVLAISRDEMTASKFPDTRSEVKVGSKSITLFDKLPVEKVHEALPRSLPRESALSDSKITSKMY